jgi:eukaryotic-like serine/threonine-protein kinase
VDSLAQDTLLGDRYRLDRRIAIGGMGEVWRAEDIVLSRTVAVKVLKSELTQERTFLERFRTEARTTASLQANGIANVFDYGEVASGDDIPVAYLVMEYVDGEPLSAQLARDGRLPAARVLEIIRQAALALAEAHRVGMVHRDVKPGNLLVRRSDGAVKITDFGIARAADAVPLTQNGMVVGTAQYFSPEQAEGRVVGPPSDVYSLGVVAYECLAGRLPFLADSPVTVAMMQIRDVPPALPPDVPGPVQALVMRILAKDPRQRFADGAELAEAVRAVQEGRPIPPPRPFPTPPPSPQPGPAQPVPTQPGLAQPGLAQPGLAQPGPSQPGPSQPGPSQPGLAQPGPSQPGTAPSGRAHSGPYGGSQFAAQSGAAGLGGPGSQPHPNPDGVGGTNPALAYPQWTPTPPAGWTAPPGEVPPRRATRRPLWIALALLLALILAGIATVLMSESGGDQAFSAVRPVAAAADSRDWNTGVSMGSMTTRVR